MPRKKKTIVEETIPDDTPQAGDDFTDAICVVSKVYKINVGGKSFCYQTTDPVDEVSVQLQYPAGGKFVVNEYNSLNQVINTTHIDIEPKPLTNNVNGNGNAEDIRTRMLMEELAFTRNMMVQMMNGLFTSRQQQSATPFGELVEGMRLMHEMSPKNGAVDLIIKGMELGQKSNGGVSDWKTELVSAAKDLVPAVAPMFTRQAAQPQGQPMIPTTPAAMMKQGIDWLKPQILGGMSVDLAIGWVIQNAKDPLCNQLISQAIRGDVNTFIAIDPEIANEPYKTWFTSAIQLLKDEYAAAQSANTLDSERGTGDDTDDAVDEKASAGKPKVVKVS
jgi:hypothetical protein